MVVATAVVLLASIPLSGCAQTGIPGSPPPQKGAAGDFQSTDQAVKFAEAHSYRLMAQILRDGKVTRDEYVESFNSWATCMEHAGVVFDVPAATWNPTDNLSLIRSWTGSPPKQTMGAQAKCWVQYNYVKQLFDETTAPSTDPQLMTFTLSCLESKKVKLVDSQVNNYTDLVKNNPSASVASVLPACVGAGIKQLYPALKGYSLAF